MTMTMQEFYKKAISQCVKTGKTLDQMVQDWENFDRKIEKLNKRLSFLQDRMLSLYREEDGLNQSIGYHQKMAMADELENTIDFMVCAKEDE
jgi:hypothetical protein